ncbi:MAG: DUF2218 domain-containing protein [Pseudomonadota bacterium]|uniref:DUF2218 domain-containing protein n=1 Tax=Phenylobacterium sp. TaxID=1871053 RepID=UPI0025E04B9E|nr:DUF2218 domain-containing protein [Phenylobacterium sp.]MBT9471026.1 DUF2218 domain-containing protein [Phenylobacterium sp.]
METRLKSSATIPTTEAQRYMVQLCKHFGHKVPATFEGQEGRITFEMGEAAMRASPETLMIISQAADPEGLGRLEQVMASHLKRFAFREPDLAVDWRRGV